MKKIIACISLVFAMSAGVTALAAVEATPTTGEGNNSVTVSNDSAYNTVLIEKVNGETSEIVYVDQNDEGFLASAATFLLKADAGYGTYTIKTNVGSGTFEISEPEPENNPVSLTPANLWTWDDGSKDLGFTLEEQSLDGYNQFVITGTTKDGAKKQLTVPFTQISGSGAVNLAVRVNKVPSDATVEVSVCCDAE